MSIDTDQKLGVMSAVEIMWGRRRCLGRSRSSNNAPGQEMVLLARVIVDRASSRFIVDQAVFHPALGLEEALVGL
jgi:hypothetical protein